MKSRTDRGMYAMPTHVPLFQELFRKMVLLTRTTQLRRTAVRRLALLVTGIVAARSSSTGKMAQELLDLHLTGASQVESIERRLRRTLADTRLTAERCYEPIVREVIDWDEVGARGQTVDIIVDESAREEAVHLFRVSLAYRGGAVPLAWAIWEQNVPLADAVYWTHVDGVLARVAQVLPTDLAVTVLADRAYDIPPFIDRCAARGWHWLIRVKAQSDLCFRDRFGAEVDLAGLLADRLPTPNRRWKIRGQVFKKAGWREVSVVGVWAAGYDEPLVVLTDQSPRWDVIAHYRRRFWFEPGVRNDKSHGWQWEESQVLTLAHQQVLLVAMAWATVLTLCLGVRAAQERTEDLHRRLRQGRTRTRRLRRPRHARQSLFTLGLQRIRQMLYHALRTIITWALPDIRAPSWNDQWLALQIQYSLSQTVRP
jgi:hypothetical protein